MREPKLIIPTTIPKFTAVDRNVLARGTKYTAEYPRVSLPFLSASLFSFSTLQLLLSTTAISSLARERVREYQSKRSTKVLPKLESPRVPWNEFFRVLFLREKRNGDNSLSEVCHTKSD